MTVVRECFVGATLSAHNRCSTTSKCATSGTPPCSATFATASTCGWSTSTRLPRASTGGCAPSVGSRHATTSATRRCDPGATSTLPRHPGHRPGAVDGSLMLANARSLGYVFNPLSVYWCHARPTEQLACVVAEVHNTYGERHCYLLRTDAARPGAHGEGVLRVAVPSPSTASTGCSLPVPTDERLALTITLRQNGFTALDCDRHRDAQAVHPCGAGRMLAQRLWSPNALRPDPPRRHRAGCAVSRHPPVSA